MGKTVTPKYRIEYKDNTGKLVQTMACRMGSPNKQKLEKWRTDYNQSMRAGGVNYPLSQSLGFLVHISWARVVRQSDRFVVCEVKMPMFEVVD